MKKVVLMPIRNEYWILKYNLPNILKWADHVLIADQHSDDGTRDLYKEYPEVVVIDNNHEGHSNEVYWQLLEASRQFGNENIIFFIDADEWVPAEEMTKELSQLSYVPGTRIEMLWPNPWGGFEKYRTDSVFKNLYKRVGWIDNGKYKHNDPYIINGHTSIIPYCEGPIIRLKTPLIHLQFMAWERLQWKHAWYRCSEHVARAYSPKRINNKYKHTLDPNPNKLTAMPTSWKNSLSVIPMKVNETSAGWQKDTVLKWIDEYGINFFEPLEIWHIPELRETFIEKTGRNPQPHTYPHWLTVLNDQRNQLKYRLRHWIKK